MAVPVTTAELKAAIRLAIESLEPIGPKFLAAELEDTLALWEFPEDAERTVRFYTEVLVDLPEDLAMLAMKRVRGDPANKWRKYMPLPAAFADAAAVELGERRVFLAKLRSAFDCAERDETNEKGG